MGKWIRLGKGYVRLCLQSDSPERFLNLCRHNGIDLWELSSDDGYYCCTSIDDYYAMRPLIKKSHMKIKIDQKKGLPFWLYRNRKRLPFFFGFGCFMFLLQILSLFIWSIDYEGNQKYTDEELGRFLRSQGYMAGMKVKDAACESLEKEIRKQYEDINWVSVMIDGTKMTVKVKENDGYLDAQMEEDEPCSLYASHSGIVRSMITRAGVPMVQVGQQVEAGQLLVSGEVSVLGEDGLVMSTRQVHASADIFVEQTLNYSDWMSEDYLQKNIVSERLIPIFHLGNFYMKMPNIWKSQSKEQFASTDMYQLCLGDSLWLPVYYGVEKISTYTETLLKKPGEEMKQEAEKKISKYLLDLQKIGVEIIQNNVTITLTAGGCLAEGEVVVWYPSAQAGEIKEIQQSQ